MIQICEHFDNLWIRRFEQTEKWRCCTTDEFIVIHNENFDFNKEAWIERLSEYIKTTNIEHHFYFRALIVIYELKTMLGFNIVLPKNYITLTEFRKSIISFGEHIVSIIIKKWIDNNFVAAGHFNGAKIYMKPFCFNTWLTLPGVVEQIIKLPYFHFMKEAFKNGGMQGLFLSQEF